MGVVVQISPPSQLGRCQHTVFGIGATAREGDGVTRFEGGAAGWAGDHGHGRLIGPRAIHRFEITRLEDTHQRIAKHRVVACHAG